MAGTGKLSKLFEIDRTTLNYYVKTGLIHASSDGIQHEYSFSDSMALALVRYYRGLGFSTEEITALLGKDTSEDRVSRIESKMQEAEQLMQILRLRLLLLNNLREAMEFIRQFQAGEPQKLMSEAYYFIRKEDIVSDPSWMELYRMFPSIEFSAFYDGSKIRLDHDDLFSHSGLAMKETWLQHLSVKPPVNSVFYPSRETTVIHFSLGREDPGGDLSRCLGRYAADFREGESLRGELVFYLFPTGYDSVREGFDCICFLD